MKHINASNPRSCMPYMAHACACVNFHMSSKTSWAQKSTNQVDKPVCQTDSHRALLPEAALSQCDSHSVCGIPFASWRCEPPSQNTIARLSCCAAHRLQHPAGTTIYELNLLQLRLRLTSLLTVALKADCMIKPSRYNCQLWHIDHSCCSRAMQSSSAIDCGRLLIAVTLSAANAASQAVAHPTVHGSHVGGSMQAYPHTTDKLVLNPCRCCCSCTRHDSSRHSQLLLALC